MRNEAKIRIKGMGGVSIQYYEKIINALSEYFNMHNWQKLFMQGGCFWLASILHQGTPNSVYMINRIEEHCALYFEKGLYDVRGRISQKNFKVAGQKEISFMKKNYVPRFNAKDLENYLYSEGLMDKKFAHL